MPPRIRRARLSDLPVLIELLTVLLTQEVEFTPNPAKHRAALSAILKNPRMGRIYVLEIDAPSATPRLGRRRSREVVGMASLLFTVSTALGGPVALFEDFVLAAAQRGKGLGRQLLDAVLADAKRLGLKRLTLLTDSDNARAQRMYQESGFSRSTMTAMRLVLSPSSRAAQGPLYSEELIAVHRGTQG